MSDDASERPTLPPPPEGSGNEWLYQALQHVERLVKNSPGKAMQQEIAAMRKILLADDGPIAKLRAEVSKVHNDYVGLHNLVSAEHNRNVDHRRRMDANWELLHDELNKVKDKQTVHDRDLAEVKDKQAVHDRDLAIAQADVVELKNRVAQVERKVG